MYVLKIPMTENGKESFIDAFDLTKNKFAAESFIHEQIQNLCKYYDNFMEALEMNIPVPTIGGGQTEIVLTLKEAKLGEVAITTNSNWAPKKFKENDVPIAHFELKISPKIERQLLGFAKIYTRRIEKHNESLDLTLAAQFKEPPNEAAEAKATRLKHKETETKKRKLDLPECVEQAVFLTLVDALRTKREEGSTKAYQQDFKEFYSEEKKQDVKPTTPKK